MAMPEIGNINQSQALSQYSSDRLKRAEEKDDKNQFLELMIAQLENQNPLDPKDGTEFLSQLAQFSTVEGVEKLNHNMQSMSENFRSSQALQATALVGRQVKVSGNQGSLDAVGALEGVVELPGSRSNVSVEVYSMTGAMLRKISLGTHPGGNVPFSWDGLDETGVRVPPGNYIVSAKAGSDQEEQLETQIQANVDSVTLDSSGGVTLNINGLGSIPISDVKEIN